MRGGLDVKKGLVVAVVVALGGKVQPADAFHLRDAYTWLNNHHTPQEIQRVSAEIVKVVEENRPPSLSGVVASKIEQVLESWKTTPPTTTPTVGGTYALTDYQDTQRDLKENDIVILQRILPAEDEDTPELYELAKLSDMEGANKGRTFSIPSTLVRLKATCLEQCGLPTTEAKMPTFQVGRARKTLRRRK